MENQLREIGNRIQVVIDSLGLSRDELGEILGVGAGAVGRYIRGEADAGAISLSRIAKVYGKTLDWLITGQGNDIAEHLAPEYPGDIDHGKIIDTQSVGKRIQNVRLENDLTLDQFANKIRVARFAVHRWEDGQQAPSLSSALLIAKMAGKTLDWLITGREAEQYGHQLATNGGFDRDLFIEASALIREAETQLNIQIRPEKFGELILLIYDEYAIGAEVPKAKVIQLVRLAA